MSDATTLSWDAEPKRIPWSAQLLKSVRDAKTQLDMGNPDKFISGYPTLTPELQLKFWAELIVAMAWYESNWKPDQIYHEPPPLGIDSVGLLQLSYEDEPNYHLEHLDRAAHSLQDPLVNLRCATIILAKLVSSNKVVTSSDSAGHRGAARYWSVMRTGHHLDEIRHRVKAVVGL